MKFVFTFFALIGAFAVALGADCEFRGQSLKVGETYTPVGDCSIYTCAEGGLVTGKTCPVVESLLPCSNENDLTKPFPDCCPKSC